MSDSPAHSKTARPHDAVTAAPPRHRAGIGRILAVALVKLLLDGVLYYVVCYDILKKAGAFSHMTSDYQRLNRFLSAHGVSELPYAAYFFGGLALSALLYLAVLALLRVRHRISYFGYALLFGFDILYVLQPSALLLTAFFCAVLFGFLRINNAGVRYPLCLLTVLLYGFFVSRVALAVIPLYLIIRLWQKNDLLAIRVCVLLLLVFCLLYQSGLIARVYEFHPGVASDATYRRLFPDENYMGHVSYYLLDTLLTLVRILLPFEVFLRMKPLLWIFGAAQIITTVWLVGTIRRLLSVDWSSPVRREERLQSDVISVLAGLFLSLCFCAERPEEVFRTISAWYPFFLYLAFAADRNPRYPVLDRELAGTCPVIFFHTGYEVLSRSSAAPENAGAGDMPAPSAKEGRASASYADMFITDRLGEVLQQAGRMCGFRNIVLIGDESGRGLVSNWVDAASLVTDELGEFREIYRTIGNTADEAFLRLNFERHFLLYSYMDRKGLDRCFLCDSDVLLYENLSELPMSDVDFACTGSEPSEFLKERISPHCAYWTKVRLRRFLDFMLRIYHTNTRWLTDVCDRQAAEGGPAYITDAVLVSAWCRLSARYDRNFRYRNLCEVRDDCMWDFSLTMSDNLTPNEYVFLPRQHRKYIRFRGRKPYFLRREDRKAVRAVCIHCRGARAYIPLLLRERGNPVWYWLARLLYGPEPLPETAVTKRR